MLRPAILMMPFALAVCACHSADAPPLLVGGHAHGAENIRILSDLGLGNFVWIPKQGYGMGNTPWDETHDIMADVDACAKHGLHFMISQRRGLGTQFKPGGAEFGGDTTPEIHTPETIREIARRGGDLFAGLHAEELDVDLIQNGLRASSRSRIPHIYDFTDRAGGRASFEGELRRIADTCHGCGEGVRFLPNLGVTLQHSGFRAGGDIVLGELLESLPNTELQLAYLRGGSHQFGKPFGVWVSPWHRGKVPAEDKELWPGPNSGVGEGHDATRFRRCLYLAWASGARVLTMQETEPLFSRDGSSGYRLAEWGRELRGFWDYVKGQQEHLEPEVPLALMVDQDSGWAPGHLHGDWIEHQTVWGKLPPERGDEMLARYLDALLPGFERTTGWWKPGGSEYPGYFAPTPAGAFDVVASDISAEKLRAYPCLVLMGEIAMTPELLATLKQYVRAGGVLHINVNQMRLREAFVQDADFLGARIGESRQWSDWSRSELMMRRVTGSDRIVLKSPLPGLDRNEWAEPWFVVQDVQLEGAEVIAETGAGLPALLRHRVGEGEVWLSTPDSLLSGASLPAERLGFFSDLLLSFARLSPVSVTSTDSGRSLKDISWVAARQAGDLVVVAANHAKEPGRVRITLAGTCRGGQVDVGGKGSFARGRDAQACELAIGPEDVAVARFLAAGPAR